MIAQSPALSATSPSTAAAEKSGPARGGVLAFLAGLVELAARSEAASTSSESDRYWTTIARGL